MNHNLRHIRDRRREHEKYQRPHALIIHEISKSVSTAFFSKAFPKSSGKILREENLEEKKRKKKEKKRKKKKKKKSLLDGKRKTKCDKMKRKKD